MTTLALDTLSFAKKLKKSGFSEEQAEALTDVILESYQARLNELATKQDLAECKSEIKTELSETKLEMVKWVSGLLLAQTALIIAAFFAMRRFMSP
ncbi:DUF1640 domain-containing protein [Magnetococcales bacterium HHB-1]